MNTHTIRILNFYALYFSRIEYYDRITNSISYMNTLNHTLGSPSSRIFLDVTEEDYKNLTTIKDENILYLYLLNLINKNKKNANN